MISGLLFFLSSMLGITWSLIFLISSIFGISIYKVSGLKQQAFVKDVKYASIWNNDEPEGWIIGKWYIGYIHKTQASRGEIINELLILCHKKYYNTNISKIEDCDDNDNDNGNDNDNKQYKIKLYEHESNSYWNTRYNKRIINCTKLSPRNYQQTIIQQIHNNYINSQTNSSVVLLHGDAGKGKSMIPYFLAKYMLSNPTNAPNKYKKILLVDTFNPSQPGDRFNILYTKVGPTKDSPLIVIIEEIDIILTSIHTNTIEKHRDFKTEITNKTD